MLTSTIGFHAATIAHPELAHLALLSANFAGRWPFRVIWTGTTLSSCARHLEGNSTTDVFPTCTNRVGENIEDTTAETPSALTLDDIPYGQLLPHVADFAPVNFKRKNSLEAFVRLSFWTALIRPWHDVRATRAVLDRSMALQLEEKKLVATSPLVDDLPGQVSLRSIQ